MNVLVIGIGNPLRGDDGAGLAAAEQVARRAPGVGSLAVQQLTPELAEQVAACDAVVFIDASVTARAVSMTRVEPEPPGPNTHVTSCGTILGLAESVYGHRPQLAVQVEIPVRDLGFGEGLSPSGEGAVAEAVDRILGLVAGRRPAARRRPQ